MDNEEEGDEEDVFCVWNDGALGNAIVPYYGDNGSREHFD